MTYYRPKEAAMKLNIGRTKMYELINTRKIGYAKVGECVLISEEDIEAYYLANRVCTIEEEDMKDAAAS
jgi:excisionase family DNA binding protein